MFPDFTSRSCANSATCQGSNGSAPPDGLDRAHLHLTSADHGWHGAPFNMVTAVFLLDRIANVVSPMHRTLLQSRWALQKIVAKASLFSCGLRLWCCVGITQVSHLGRTIKLKGKLNETWPIRNECTETTIFHPHDLFISLPYASPTALEIWRPAQSPPGSPQSHRTWSRVLWSAGLWPGLLSSFPLDLLENVAMAKLEETVSPLKCKDKVT